MRIGIKTTTYEAQPKNVKVCTGEEDPTCSDSILSLGNNLAHLEYFGQSKDWGRFFTELARTDIFSPDMALDPSLCGF